MAISQPIQGLDQDISPKLQQPGTYRFALNASINSIDGQDQGGLTNEQGNAICATQELAGSRVCGSVQLNDHKHLLFVKTTLDSRLTIYDPKACTFDHIMITPTSGTFGDCLDFDPCYPIKAEFRVREGCKRFVYFTDGKSPMRAINIDNIPQYLTSFEVDCSKFTYTPTIASMPVFETATVFDTGGINVPVGTVQFAIRLITQDGGRTNWLYVTQPVPITGTAQRGPFHEIHGSRNEDDVLFTQDAGTVPATTKSVRIALSNIDTNFESFQIASILTTGETAIANLAYEHEEVPITGATQTYVWRGIDASSVPVAVENIIVDSAIIDTVKDLEQIDNRMVLANEKSKDYPWATIQQAANTITSKWVEGSVVSYIDMDKGASKSSEYYFNRRGYHHNEVYAFGIRGRFKLGGGYTPVAHIPGRLKDILVSGEVTAGNGQPHYRPAVPTLEWDSFLYNVADPVVDPTTEVSLENVRHLGFNAVGDDPFGTGIGTVERWRVFNTAVYLADGAEGSGDDDFLNPYSYGYMSYWESDTDYPDTEDCNGDRIYPEGKIRHHKFPDHTLRPAWTDPTAEDDQIDITTHPLGIQFDIDAFLAALPSSITDDIVSWEIVRVHRDENNTTVIDTGYVDNAADNQYGGFAITEDPEFFTPPITSGFHDRVVTFDSPKTLLQRIPLGEDYYKLERVYSNLVLHVEEEFPLLETPDLYANYHAMTFDEEDEMEDNTEYHRVINNSIYLDYADPIIHEDIDTIPGFPTVTDTIGGFDVGNGFYSIPRYVSLLEDTKDISDIDLLDDRHPFGTTEGERKMYYVSYMKYNPFLYSNLDTLVYFAIDNGRAYDSNDILFGGDVFISKWNFRQMPTIKVDQGSRLAWFYGINPNYPLAHMLEVMSESTVNASLRTEDQNEVAHALYHFTDSFVDYLNSVNDLVDPATGTNEPIEYRDYLDYNPDYSKCVNDKPEFPLDDLHDYCDPCDNLYPFRIRYSERSYQEEEYDNYRTLLANNYRDLDGETGEITNLFVQNDELYTTTKKAIYFVPVRPQTLETNESVAFVGIGDVLSVPPKRLLTSDFSFGGCSDPETLVTTEYGTIWADSNSENMFLLSNDRSVSAINIGMNSFFKNNLDLEIDCDLNNQLGLRFECRSTLDEDYSAGMIAEYDPAIMMYYMHKKDYKIPEELLETLTLFDEATTVEDDFVWDPATQRFGVGTGPGTYEALSFSDEDYFENRSFTISLHVPTLLSQQPGARPWISFHSWLPNYMFSSDRELFTFKVPLNDDSLDIWKHRSGIFNNFYGVNQSFWLDMVYNSVPNRTRVFDQLSVVMDVMSYDTTKKQWYYVDDITFTNGHFYNDDQSSDEQRIVVKDRTNPFDRINLGYTVGTILADRTTDQWNFNNIKDWSVDHNTEPIWTSQFSEITGQFPIDRVVNPDIIDYNKSLFQNSKLRGEWFGSRLRFTQPLGGNYKFIVNIAETMERFNTRDFKAVQR